MTDPLWRPSEARVRAANLTAFTEQAATRWNLPLDDYEALHAWSIREPEQFWTTMWDFGGVVAERRGERVLVDGDRMPGARWFPDARLNYAENLLRRRDDGDALVFRNESGERRRLSFRALHDQVSACAAALRDLGVTPGDRVAGYLPNMPEAMVAALATASLGAVWSSCSPDFGVQGVLDRFAQIEPRILVAADGYRYGGKAYDVLPKVREVARGLPTVRRTLVVPYLAHRPSLDGLASAERYDDATAGRSPAALEFVQVPFDHPLFIMYSSGTTGAPKCIVHGVGGTLLQHLKEHKLHCDIRRDDRVFYFTTCGWMMWNWLLSVLASDATPLLYDGSPAWPTLDALFDMADAEGMTLFGTSAKFIDTLRKAKRRPMRTHRLAALRTMTSTGSPLAPEGFDYVYEHVKADLHLASVSGGTDILSCFAGGNPIGPVRRGELQVRALAMAVDVFDDRGRPLRGEPGELVCTAPFPSMPVGFWNDPDGALYRRAYFDTFPGVWRHGDWVELTEHGGMVFHGRSDAVLNPGGVRIGTAEIYRQVEQLEEVAEALCVGQAWEGDERVVLFVRLREGVTLDEALTARITRRIRERCSPRHAPAKVVQVADIPRTRSGKITELAVREVIHGRPVKNREALANPESLELFRDLDALRR